MPNSNIKYQISNIRNQRIAIVADWIDKVGGAERVLVELAHAFPGAPIYTSTYEPDERFPLFKEIDIHTSWMQRLPKALRKHQLLTIPRQWYFSRLKLRDYDIVISAGSAEAKAVHAQNGMHVHICYTPTLYYWVKPDNYLKRGGTGGINQLWRFGLKVLLPRMKAWDRRAAQNPDKIYAISTAVQKRIKTIYERDAAILFPPADIERFKNDGKQSRSGFVVWGRQVQHKRFDLAISACNEAGRKLTVIGDGPEHERLKALAGPTITFKRHVSDNDMPRLIAQAEAFIFPNEEDFGIVAVEAQAAGLPVIAFRAGGALDTVIEGVTGEFFDKQTTDCLAQVVKNFNFKLFNRQDITTHAQKFSTDAFIKNISQVINS